jgi:transposase
MMGILEYSQLLSSERSAKDYYKRLRWRDGRRRCFKCGDHKLFPLSDGRYECRSCHARFSDFSGTYLSGIKLGFDKVGWLVYLFSLELSVRRSARELGVNYKTAYNFFDRIRRAITANDYATGLSGEVELDETYVGGKRKGKRGRGAAGKVPVFGMLERAGKVVVEVVSDVKEKTLMGLITKTIEPGSLTYSDGFKSYNSLIVNGYEHIRIDHEKEFANGKAHINSIESFWAYAKERLAKYHGVSPLKLYLYLKELEFRFNNRQALDLFELINSQLVKSLRYCG